MWGVCTYSKYWKFKIFLEKNIAPLDPAAIIKQAVIIVISVIIAYIKFNIFVK